MNQHIIPLTVYNQTMQELLSLYPADRGSLSVLNHSDKMSAMHNLLNTNAMNNESHYSNRCNQNGRISLHMTKHTHSQHSQGCQFSSILGRVAFCHPWSSYSLCFPFLSPPSSSSPQKVQLGSLDCAVSGQWLSDGCRRFLKKRVRLGNHVSWRFPVTSFSSWQLSRSTNRLDPTDLKTGRVRTQGPRGNRSGWT